MGRRIETLATERGYEVVHRLDCGDAITREALHPADVAIEFTAPQAALSNVKALLHAGIPVVTGTTGWYQHLAEAQTLCQKLGGKLFYASNFSIGVHLAQATSDYLARLMQRTGGYRPSIEEWHHTAKKDAPSGTAITFAERLMKANNDYTHWALTSANALHQAPKHILPIAAHREDEIPGTHRVQWQGTHDAITIEHRAHNRDGFALGAISAAAWLLQAAPGTYSMNHLIPLNA
jgi:4-hydroxy-tetrahydrodipicolinate reductase